jgi:hypothetical protein
MIYRILSSYLQAISIEFGYLNEFNITQTRSKLSLYVFPHVTAIRSTEEKKGARGGNLSLFSLTLVT